MNKNTTVEPPWIKFNGSTPTWGGWRQGVSEHWLLHVWLPFWRGLTEEERAVYLSEYPCPGEEWIAYLTVHWL